jgi:hypothetical protein
MGVLPPHLRIAQLRSPGERRRLILPDKDSLVSYVIKPRARRTDPSTSHAAAASVGHLRENQARILDILRNNGPMDDEHIYRAYVNRYARISLSGCRTRRKELVDLGLVVDSGKRSLTQANRKSIIWKLAD